jgi:predicted kinase
MKMIIMRGLPGSGKSTLARSYGGLVFSTDDFFVKDGVYHFDPTKLRENHDLNYSRTLEALKDKVPIVVIDNTNVQRWEVERYVRSGIEHGYIVEFSEPSTFWKFSVDELAVRNSHGVSRDVIQNMLDRWENFTIENFV